MRLKELAEKELKEGDDFKVHPTYNFRQSPRVNDIGTKIISDYIIEEKFRFGDKTRYMIKKDGQEIPFATVERVEGSRKFYLFGERNEEYNVRLAILPCMIPSALEALTSHMQSHSFYKTNDKMRDKAKVLLSELLKTLETTLIEEKEGAASGYQQKQIA